MRLNVCEWRFGLFKNFFSIPHAGTTSHFGEEEGRRKAWGSFRSWIGLQNDSMGEINRKQLR